MAVKPEKLITSTVLGKKSQLQNSIILWDLWYRVTIVLPVAMVETRAIGFRLSSFQAARCLKARKKKARESNQRTRHFHVGVVVARD